MIRQSESDLNKTGPLVGGWIQIVRVLLFLAAVITGYLALAALSQAENIPGCGSDSGCDKVLNSKWAYWLNIPVSLPGLGLYAVFFISTFGIKAGNREKAKRSLNTLTLCASSVIAAAVWFVGIQAIAIKSFCPWCCTAHGLASLAAILFIKQAGTVSKKLSVRLNLGGAGVVAAGLVAVIAAVQVFSTSDDYWNKQLASNKTNEVKEATKTNTFPVASQTLNNQTNVSSKVSQATTAEKTIKSEETPFPIPKTNLSLITSKLPVIGNRNATNRFAVMFDYTCHHCRKLHSFVRQIIPKYENKLSCIMIPMPLDSKCNPLIKTTHADHINACNYAKICLAVHQIAPDKYDEFDKWLFNDHNKIKSYSSVLKYAEGITSKDSIIKAMDSQLVLDQLATNIEVYKLNSKNGDTSIMPQAIIKSRVMFGPPPSAEALESLLNQFLDLK